MNGGKGESAENEIIRHSPEFEKDIDPIKDDIWKLGTQC